MRSVVRLGQHFCQQQPRRWWLGVLLGALVGIAAGRSLNTSVSVVDGESMAPTYSPGARVLTEPPTKPIERGDIVLLDDGHRELALKRIIGLPGETVKLWRGNIFINGRMLFEPYLSRRTYTFPDERAGLSEFCLSAEEFFVLGDNRPCSVDSRQYGPVNETRVKGAVPLPEHVMRPRFTAYRLPRAGTRTIH